MWNIWCFSFLHAWMDLSFYRTFFKSTPDTPILRQVCSSESVVVIKMIYIFRSFDHIASCCGCVYWIGENGLILETVWLVARRWANTARCWKFNVIQVYDKNCMFKRATSIRKMNVLRVECNSEMPQIWSKNMSEMFAAVGEEMVWNAVFVATVVIFRECNKRWH